jgi:hypothetical protein
MIKINFNINGFQDSLHLPNDHEFTDAEIEAMKQERYEKWDAFVKNPPLVTDAPIEE